MKDAAREEIGRIPVRRLALYFFRLGFLGFGGPVAVVGQMERELVARRNWLKPEELREAVAICQPLPGPLSTQVGIFIAYLRGGLPGAWWAGWAFIAPNFLLGALLGALFVHFGDLKGVTAAFYGASPAVIVLILSAIYQLAKLGMEDALQWTIAASCFLITIALEAEPGLLFVLSGVIGIAFYGNLFQKSGKALLLLPPFSLKAILAAAKPGIALTSPSFQLFLFFLKASALTFGSGLLVLPFMQQGLVTEYGWLGEREFLIAVALGIVSPGPAIITATFAGYLVAGFAGALSATIGFFLPSFLTVLFAAPIVSHHRQNANLQGCLKGVYAAAIGATLGACLLLEKVAIGDGFTIAVALCSVAAVFLWEISGNLVVVAAGLAGLVAYPVFQPAWLTLH